MRVMVLLLALASALTFAADNAAIAPRTATSFKPQATSFGTEAITIPQMLSYQGKLTDTTGIPVPNGDYSVVFRLYTAPSGGSPIWNEIQSVTTKDGLFSVLLGSVTPISSMPDAGAAFLAMAIDGGAELTPRLRIASVAYAYKADTANYAQAAPPVGPSGGDLVASYPNPTVDGILGNPVVGANPGVGQVLKWTGSVWTPQPDEVGSGDNAWVRGSPDSVLFTVHELGIARGSSFNMLHGGLRSSHTNLGIACTTGVSGQLYRCCAVGGGGGNVAGNDFATVAGGYTNRATGGYATIAGGELNSATGILSTVGGGHNNRVNDTAACVAGGFDNWAYWPYSFIGGGYANRAQHRYSVVGGGYGDTTSGNYSVIGGGYRNATSSDYSSVLGGNHNAAAGTGAAAGGGRSNLAGGSGGDACIAGGYANTAWGSSATVGGGTSNWVMADEACIPGGRADSVSGNYGFATNYNSSVGASFTNSAAFNGQSATASNQTRVGTLSKASGTFTIDHPLDPVGKILNHYFIEGPEMLNIYRGSVALDAVGRAEVQLPAYFDALNSNPMVQLTGVGGPDVVYVAEDVAGNRFVIGGKPGTKVYWQVTGERKDVSAEATRRMMPVEQPKTGDLAGRMLDDEFLSGCMDQLVREGKAQGIDFRTAGGRQRYEKMKQAARKQ